MIIDQRKEFAFIYPWDEGKAHVEVICKRGITIKVPEMSMAPTQAKEWCEAITQAVNMGATMMASQRSESRSIPEGGQAREQPSE